MAVDASVLRRFAEEIEKTTQDHSVKQKKLEDDNASKARLIAELERRLQEKDAIVLELQNEVRS